MRHIDSSGFMECSACSAKPGSQPLCPSCLHNRTMMEQYHRNVVHPKPSVLSRMIHGVSKILCLTCSPRLFRFKITLMDGSAISRVVEHGGQATHLHNQLMRGESFWVRADDGYMLMVKWDDIRFVEAIEVADYGEVTNTDIFSDPYIAPKQSISA